MGRDWGRNAAAIVDGKNRAGCEMGATVGKNGLDIQCEAEEIDAGEWAGCAAGMAAHLDDGRWAWVIKGRAPKTIFDLLSVKQLIDRHEILLYSFLRTE